MDSVVTGRLNYIYSGANAVKFPQCVIAGGQMPHVTFLTWEVWIYT